MAQSTQECCVGVGDADRLSLHITQKRTIPAILYEMCFNLKFSGNEVYYTIFLYYYTIFVFLHYCFSYY